MFVTSQTQEARGKGGKSRIKYLSLVGREGALFSAEEGTIWEWGQGEAPVFPSNTTLFDPAGACEGGEAAQGPAGAGGDG